MSHTPPISQPPEPLQSTPPRSSRLPSKEAAAAAAEAIRRLTDELAQATDRGRQARLLAYVADLHERLGEEPAAARDFLAAFNTDPTFREPLEGLVRLLEKRRSLKNFGKIVGALVRSASSPDEKVRALLTRAAHQADVAGEVADAKASVLEATQVEGASAAEQASAWLALEVLAGRTADRTTRLEALGHRVDHAPDRTWRALLLLDQARMVETAGDVEEALTLAEAARALESTVTWTATATIEQLASDHRGTPGSDEGRDRLEIRATALEASADLVLSAIADEARGDAMGVPHSARNVSRMADAWLRAADARQALGQLDRAATLLDRALEHLASFVGEETRTAEAVITYARIRIAERAGQTALAAHLSERRLAIEANAGLAAALAMRVAEYSVSRGDVPRALEALSRAIGADPGSLPARALELDLLAEEGNPGTFAAQLESLASHFATDEARSRTLLLAAYVWAVRATDTTAAKAALRQAAAAGCPGETIERVARALASAIGDAGWYEESTRRLIAAGATDGELLSLQVELLRMHLLRSDAAAIDEALREMGETPSGAWLARVLEAFPFVPDAGPGHGPGYAVFAETERARAALGELATLEPDPDVARTFALVAALRALSSGDATAARSQLRILVDRDPSDVTMATLLADLDRNAGDAAAAARVAASAASSVNDAALAAALHLEAAFDRWTEGDRKAAIDELGAAMHGAPEAAKLALGWALRGVETTSVQGRLNAIDHSRIAGTGDERVLALERFALAAASGDSDGATAALQTVERADGPLGVAAAIARLIHSTTPLAIDRIAALGPGTQSLAAAEQFRLAREASDSEEQARSARKWFDAGGGAPAALEWLAAAAQLGRLSEEAQARLALSTTLTGEAREALVASAALLELDIHPERPASLADGVSACTRLANLELAPPGCDPRRRATVLAELGEALGSDARIDALSLAGWSALVTGDPNTARASFEEATAARPSDLASWEGLRTCSERTGDNASRARAAAELGTRRVDAAGAAAFWEEAGLLWLELGDEANGERALEASFVRDPKRAVAFDKLFRRVRERKDNDKLIALIVRRLNATDDLQEIEKLYWEQARALRQKGDTAGALEALEHVTMLDADHVGALALLGEINIRRGNFEDAATSLARLATLQVAPAKSRVTAGVAAVDLYENKLDRSDKAFEVLVALHAAKLSTLPVRERLARTAARIGAWDHATSMLQELMLERPDPQGRVEAARLALAIHRDRLNDTQGAAPAAVKLLEEAPADGEALDLLLQTQQAPETRERLLKNAVAFLVEALRAQPTDEANVGRLARVARALGDDALEHAALGALLSLGAEDTSVAQLFAQVAARKARVPQTAIGAAMLKNILAPGDDGPIAELFVLLGPTLAEALGPNLQAWGVGRRDRVEPRSGLGLRNEIGAWAGALGVSELDLYVGGQDAAGVQGISGEPPAVVVGPGVNAPLPPMTRARVARELLAVVRGTTVVRSRDQTAVAAIVVAACRLADVPVDHPPYAVLAEIERLMAKAIPRRTRKAIGEVCRAISHTKPDARLWSRRAIASQDRIAVVACGDPSLVLGDALGVGPANLGQAVRGSARAQELLRYVLSTSYLEARRALGLEGSS
jgi:tetratricopeptide (TPR) repeat protein/lipopolysaccharide biosynthesis regulator YciM